MSNPIGKIAHAGLDGTGEVIRRLQRLLGIDGTETVDAEPRSRWRSVTINKSPEEVMPDGRVPDPLAALGNLVEVEVRKAPGDKGTELAARLRQPEPGGLRAVVTRVSGDDPHQQVRAALRQAKQLIEVGEVLRLEPTPHGARSATPTGKLVDIASRRAGGEGLL